MPALATPRPQHVSHVSPAFLVAACIGLAPLPLAHAGDDGRLRADTRLAFTADTTGDSSDGADRQPASPPVAPPLLEPIPPADEPPLLTPEPERPRKRPSLTFAAAADFAFKTRFNGQRPGNLTTTRAMQQITITRSRLVNPKVSLVFGIDGEQAYYNFTGINEFTPGAGSRYPFSDVYSLELRPGFAVSPSRDLTWFATAIIRYAGASGADFEDALQFGGSGGFVAVVNPQLRLGFVILAREQLIDDGLEVIPLPIIEYQINPYFRVGTGQFPTGGGGAFVAWAPRSTVEFKAAFGFQQFEYALAESSAVGDGAASDRSKVLNFTATFKPKRAPRLEIFGNAGFLLDREIKLEDGAGIELGDPGLDTNFFAGGGLSWSY